MKNFLQFSPTNDQSKALESLTSFVSEGNNSDFFILKGSAGTGKTTILKAATDYLVEQEINFRLCAPTGRAAKIISTKTNRRAKTIHGEIYIVKDSTGHRVVLESKLNHIEAFTVFFIDEASMLADHMDKNGDFITPSSILADLIKYVKQGNKKNKIVFVGDNYQLPPVNTDKNKDDDFSPALLLSHIESKYNLKGEEIAMTEVMRQKEGSSILNIATHIRTLITAKKIGRGLLQYFHKYTYALNHLLTIADYNDTASSIVICKTNKDVDWWNSRIREKLGKKGTLCTGDIVQIQGNTTYNSNYYTKGEMGIIDEVISPIENYAGIKFQDIRIRIKDLDGKDTFREAKVMLDATWTDHGKLDPNIETALIASAKKHNKKYRESDDKSDDKYLSALRLRHSFAITCHKAQGGEWDYVYIHPFMMYDDMKWMYTAVTRARKEVYTWAA
jgi:exodeoxyribonuclease-5